MPTTNTVPKQESNGGKRAFGFMRPPATQGLPNTQVKKVATHTTPNAKAATKNYVFAQCVPILPCL